MFKDLYKQNVNEVERQQSRRQALLQEQKRKRSDLQDESRFPRESEIVAKNRHRTPRSTQRAFNFKDAYRCDLSLQLSEWLRERPEDLTDWLLVPCPRGQRCLVVASEGRTEMYSKAGRRRFIFRSMLPGDGIDRKSISILDCVYAQEEDAFYVLDALAFGNQELLHCEAQFRFFWLRSKFEEHDQITECGERNEKPFHLTMHYDFEDTERVSVALQRFPLWPNNKPALDGFLFYHKEGSYTSGTTPLVCWLFAFMVPDVLGYQVSSSYERPAEYVDPLQYMESFDKQLTQKKHQRRISTKDMDTSVSVSEDGQSAAIDEEYASLASLVEAERQLEME